MAIVLESIHPLVDDMDETYTYTASGGPNDRVLLRFSPETDMVVTYAHYDRLPFNENFGGGFEIYIDGVKTTPYWPKAHNPYSLSGYPITLNGGQTIAFRINTTNPAGTGHPALPPHYGFALNFEDLKVEPPLPYDDQRSRVQFQANSAGGSWPNNFLTYNFIDESQGIGGITDWLWDFGDGSTSTLQNPSHTYADVGIYKVRLTITTVLGGIVSGEDFIPSPSAGRVSLIYPTYASNGVLPAATVGDLYNINGIEIGLSFGGADYSAYNLTLTSGSLPPGLALQNISYANYTITGTPTTADIYNFELTADDPWGDSFTRPFVLSVIDYLPHVCQGNPYTHAITPPTGVTAPYTWSLDTGYTLPDGITLDAATGTLSGTPTTPGTYNIRLKVTEDGGAQSTAYTYVQLGIGATPVFTDATLLPRQEGMPPEYTGITFPTAIYGTSYAFRINVSNTTAQYSAYVSNDSDPVIKNEFNINEYVGYIEVECYFNSPTYTTSPYNFTIVLENYTEFADYGSWSCPVYLHGTVVFNDANGAVDTNAYSITVVDPLTISTDSYLYACTGNNVSLEIQAAGGTLPYTWALGEGDVLPDGVSLSYSGNSAFLTGNIPDPLLYYVWLDVIDANNLTVGNNFRLIIEDTPNITTTMLPDAQTNVDYVSTVLVDNKSPQALFELVEGSTLPSGLSLNIHTGEIYGRPDVPGEYTFAIRVKNYYFPII